MKKYLSFTLILSGAITASANAATDYNLILNNKSSLELHYDHYQFNAGNKASNDLGVTFRYMLNKIFSLSLGVTGLDRKDQVNHIWAGVIAHY